MTPWYGVVLEVKNIGGTLDFRDNPPQLIRTREDGHKDGFDSPVVQLERNCELLNEWLRCRNIQLPIYGAIVLAYPKQMVAVPPAKAKILFPNLIPSYLKSLPQKAKKLDHDTFNWLSAELVINHQMFIPKPISDSYKIPYGDFQNGVWCEVCDRIGMIKHPRTWYCPNCEAKNSLAFQKTLREWFLLFGGQITNRECRAFLQVDDKYTANRILKSMNLASEGTYRDRSYILDLRNRDNT